MDDLADFLGNGFSEDQQAGYLDGAAGGARARSRQGKKNDYALAERWPQRVVIGYDESRS